MVVFVSNFYDNNTPSIQAGWAPYSTSTITTLERDVLAGNVVYYNGQYWSTPDHVSMAKNEEVVYYNDVAPEAPKNRHTLADMVFN